MHQSLRVMTSKRVETKKTINGITCEYETATTSPQQHVVFYSCNVQSLVLKLVEAKLT